MPEEQPAPVEETQDTSQTPEAPAPQEATSEESFTDSYNPADLPEEARAAYESAYKSMQADYSRKTQAIAAQRQEAEQYQQIVAALQDPEYRDEALKLLGVELPDPTTDDSEYVDPTEQLQAQVDEMRQQLTQQSEQAQEAEYQEMEMDYLANQLETLEEREGSEFSEDEVKFLVAYSTSNRLADGAPDIESALQVMDGASKAKQSRYVASKKAPRKPGSGVAGSSSVDRNVQKDRLELMAEAAEAQASSE